MTWTRDAQEAYLQAPLKRKNSARTFIALPQCFWPADWGDKFTRPMVELELALFGHPECGNIWENRAFTRLREKGWVDAPEFPSVFKHKDGSILTCYDDGFELQSTLEVCDHHWD